MDVLLGVGLLVFANKKVRYKILIYKVQFLDFKVQKLHFRRTGNYQHIKN